MFQQVLVIDDDPAIHKLAESHLCNWQTKMCSAFDGEQGMAVAVEQRPDLILLDVDMPGMNGVEVCQRLKANPATHRIPILFLTAAGSTKQKIIGFNAGATDYVTKPFEPTELRARAKAVLRTKQQMETMASQTMIDQLTGLFTREFLDRQVPAESARAQRLGWPLACFFIEIDGYASILENHGHVAADETVTHLALVLEHTCRREDLLCRAGTEQFAVLASHRYVADIIEIADRIRTVLRENPVNHLVAAFSITASIGVAISRVACGRSIVQVAEEAASRAKLSGGDCVKIGGSPIEFHGTN